MLRITQRDTHSLIFLELILNGATNIKLITATFWPKLKTATEKQQQIITTCSLHQFVVVVVVVVIVWMSLL